MNKDSPPIALQHNESYWLLSDALIDRVKGILGQRELSCYPDYSALSERLANYAGVDADQVCVTAGSDAAISLIAEAHARDGKAIVLPSPTFYGYEKIFSRWKAAVRPTFYREAHGAFIFPREETMRLMRSEHVASVFLCHPNNPLGSLITESDLAAILEVARATGVNIVMDEAYLEYGGTTLVEKIADYPVVVLRTMSKAFGLSGARVGYTLAPKEYVANMRALLLPWPVAHPSVIAAEVLLDAREEVAELRIKYIEHRDIFVNDLRGIGGITVYSSATNFVLMRVPDAAQAQARLAQNGIHVALGEPMTAYPEGKKLLASTLRLAIPSPAHTEMVLRCLKEALR